MKYDSIKRRFVKSSSKSRILALSNPLECSLSKTCLVSADLSNRRCRMSAKCSFLRMEKTAFCFANVREVAVMARNLIYCSLSHIRVH